MDAELAALPDDVETLKAALLAARAETAVALAEQSSNRALIAHLKLQIEKLNRDRFGPRSERTPPACWTRWSCSSRNSRPQPPRTNWPRKPLLPRPPTVTGFTRARPARRPVPRAPTARARRRSRSSGLRLLRQRPPIQIGRGRHREPRDHPPHLEGHPARAREVLLPGLRAHQPAPGAVPRDPARLGRAEPAVDDPVREVRPASAAQSSGRALCSRGRADQPVHAGRPGRHLHDGADAVVSSSGGPCHGRPAATRRRHPRCRSLPVARPTSPGSGLTCATTGRSADRHRQGRYFTIRAIAAASIRKAIWMDMPGCSRPMPMAATASSTSPDASQARSWRRHAGPTHGESSSCWPTLRATRARAAQGKSPAVLSPICLEAVQRIDALFDIEREINGHRRSGAPSDPTIPVGTTGRRSASVARRATRQAGTR